jgi:hypothetical protein
MRMPALLAVEQQLVGAMPSVLSGRISGGEGDTDWLGD